MYENEKHKTFFDHHAPTWHHRIDENSRRRLKYIFEKKIPPLQAPVLDIGSGTGALLPALFRGASNRYQIIEADFSGQMLAENRLNNGNQPGIYYVQSDAHHLPFKTWGFKSIVCFAAFAHFYDKIHVIGEFSNILESGGHLVILHFMCHYRLNQMHREVGGPVKYDHLPAISDVSSMLTSAGFTILHGEEDKNIFLISARR